MSDSDILIQLQKEIADLKKRVNYFESGEYHTGRSLSVLDDLRVGSGAVIGNATPSNNPGNGEVWLQEQSAIPAATSSVIKLRNYKGVPVIQSASSVRQFMGASVDLLLPMLQYGYLRGVWYGDIQVQNSVQTLYDRLGSKHLTATGSVFGNISQPGNAMYPIGYCEASAGNGNYLSVGTPTDFAANNYVGCFGWFYIPSTGATVRPLVSLGTTIPSWTMTIYNNVLGTVIYDNITGATKFSPGAVIIPNAWNFVGLGHYWNSTSDYWLANYANGAWGAGLSSAPAGYSRNPTGAFSIFYDGTNYSPGFRMASLVLGIHAGPGGLGGYQIDTMYELSKAYFGH